MYQGLFNSSYIPDPRELDYIYDPVNLLGPWFLSAMFSLLLNGIILVQTHNYAEYYTTKDPLWLRLLVYSSCLLCVAKSADTLSITWRIFVKQFGDYWSLADGWTLDQIATIVLSSFIGFFVQTYFIHRAFMLSRNWYFLVVASFFALSGPVASIVHIMIVSDPNGHDVPPYLIAATMMIVGTFVADGIITGFTCWYLLKQSRISRFAGTKDLIARLVTVSMQSAVLPFAWYANLLNRTLTWLTKAPTSLNHSAIANLVFNFRLFNQDSDWVILFNMLMPYFYVKSLLFTLNSRSKPQVAGENQGAGPDVHGSHSVTLKSPGLLWPKQTENRTTEVYVTITSQSRAS